MRKVMRWITFILLALVLVGLFLDHKTTSYAIQAPSATADNFTFLPALSMGETLLPGWTEIEIIPDEIVIPGQPGTTSCPGDRIDVAATSDGSVFIAWTSDGKICFREWKNGVWSNTELVVYAVGDQIDYLSLAPGPDDHPYMAFTISGVQGPQLYVMHQTSAGWVSLGNVPGEPSSINTYYSAELAFSVSPNGIPYLAWVNFLQPDESVIYIKRWVNNSWQEVGLGSASGKGISDDNLHSWRRDPQLAIDSEGNVYVAWTHNYLLTVYSAIYIKQWNGLAWAEVGQGSASTPGGIDPNSKPRDLSLALGLGGRPYIAWVQDRGILPSEVYVRFWAGSTWQEVSAGSATDEGISHSKEAGVSNTTIATNVAGNLYVTWIQSVSMPNGDTVSETYGLYFANSNWQEMGSGSASGGGISNQRDYLWLEPSMTVDANGRCYVFWLRVFRVDSNQPRQMYLRYWQP